MLANNIHTVIFADQVTIDIDVDSLYEDQIIDSIIEKKFNGRQYKGLPIVTSTGITTYDIKDPKTASKQGVAKKQQSDEQAQLVLDSILTNTKRPFCLVTYLNGGSHYQGLIAEFKANKTIDVQVINSILRAEDVKLIQEELRRNLTIFEKLGFEISKLEYSQCLLQEHRHDCGVVLIENLAQALSEQVEKVPSRRLTKEESIILRAKQKYEFQHKRKAPEVILIDGKPLNAQALIATTVATKTAPKTVRPLPASPLKVQIARQCIAIFGANTNQATRIAELVCVHPNMSLEEHISDLTAKWSNLNCDPQKLLERLEATMSKGPLLLSRNNALPTVLAPAKPAPKEDAEQEIIQLCLELFGANKEQAHKLLPFILHRGNQTLENRIAELQTLYFNSNEDVVRLIDRLNNNASKKLGANL